MAAPQQQLTLLFMLRHSRVALLFFLVVCLGTLANCLTYYTLSFAADALSLSLYLNFLLLSAIEGPSYLAAAALVDRWVRAKRWAGVGGVDVQARRLRCSP